ADRNEPVRQPIGAPEADTGLARDPALWPICAELDSPAPLRREIHRLAGALATAAGIPEAVIPTDYGLGFAWRPSPAETPLALSVHLLLGALLRAHDPGDWQDRKSVVQGKRLELAGRRTTPIAQRVIATWSE